MTATDKGVLAVMGAVTQVNHGDDEGDFLMADVYEAHAAAKELRDASDRTIKAFEALGRSNGVVAQLESHRECERALIAQKEAQARFDGAQP